MTEQVWSPFYLKVLRLHPQAKLPHRANPTDAGLDLFALDTVIIPPFTVARVRTGIAMELPKGTMGIILDKSSVGSNGRKTFGGVIDEPYRGEIEVVLGNLASKPHTPINPWIIEAGTKIAQLVIVPILRPTPYEVTADNFDANTDRGTGGFGSSGVR